MMMRDIEMQNERARQTAASSVIADCDRLAAVEGYDYRKPVQAHGYLSRDGNRKYLIVSRFKDKTAEIRVSARGAGGAEVRLVPRPGREARLGGGQGRLCPEGRRAHFHRPRSGVLRVSAGL